MDQYIQKIKTTSTQITYLELDCISKVNMLVWMKENGLEKMMEDYIKRHMTLDAIDRISELCKKGVFDMNPWVKKYILDRACDVVDVNTVEWDDSHE